MTRRNSGFTLVEILVATAIFAVIMIAALMMYDKNQQVFKQSVEAADMQQNARVAFDKMVADVRMAGFDFNRDGEPQLAGQVEQPDEQIEYADTRAVTIRANLDYDANLPGDADNGRETAWESGSIPVVTTGNDEIVTYALRSKVSGKNLSTIVIRVDLNKPRSASEANVTIDNVDTTGLNPPYELVRIGIDPSDASKFIRTTIADNIRDLKFDYFTDVAGLAANQVTTMPLGADGASGATKAIRATIRSIRVELTGMNANPDVAYVNPTETDTTVTTAKNYRTYKLESLLVPRNLGLRGMQEVEAQAPGSPTINGLCVGACGFVNVQWSKPSAGAPVSSYTVTWDTSATGSYSSLVPFGNVTTGWAGQLDPTKSYYFKVRSLNGYGSNASGAMGPVFPTNKTTPDAPKSLTATAGAGALQDEVLISFPNPTDNVSGAYGAYGGSTSCPVVPSATIMPSLNEVTTYKVYRSSTSGFTPTDAGVSKNLIWSGGLTAGVLDRDASNNLNFHDLWPAVGTPGVTYPQPSKLNCATYYYKIIAVEPCSTTGAANDNDAPASTSAASAEVSGNSNALSVPNTPTGLTATGASGCSGGLCTIVLQWNEVTRDSTNYIAINTYILHRQIWKLGSLESESDLPAVTVTPGTTPTFSDAGLDQKDMFGSFYQYRYTVKASQCSGTNESAFSSEVIWPCANFTVDPPASGVLSGSGAAGDPYLITSPSGLFTVNGSLPISAVVATYTNLTTSATTAMPATPIGAVPTTTWTLNLPLSANDGTRYRIDVTVTDAANGCTTSNSPGTFAEDAPSSCCLEPYKLASAGNPIFNNAVLTLDSVNNTVNVKLVNDCDVDLTITNVDIDFTRDLGAQSGRLKLKKVVFNSPAGTGNQDFGGTAQAPAVSLPGTAALPTSPANGLIIRSVLANRTYIIDLQFQNRAVTLADILQVCITYTNPSATTFQCRIAPQASANANCNP